MIEEQATIIFSNDDYIEVEINQQSSCSSCDAQSSCGTSALSQLFGQRPSIFKLPLKTVAHSQILKTGDMILIGLEDAHYLQASSLIYLLPLVTLFSSALIAEQFLAANDAVVALFGVVGLWLGFKWSGFIAQSSKHLITPRFVKKL